jgi:hypothetical protein
VKADDRVKKRLARTARLVLTGILGMIIIARIPACEVGPTRPGIHTHPLINASALTLPSSTPTPEPTPTDDAVGDEETNAVQDDIVLSVPEGGIPVHTMDVVLNARDRRMQVAHYVLLHNSSQTSWSEVVFAVLPRSKTDVFRLDEVEVTQRDSRRRITPRWEQMMLHVPLPVTLAPGDPVGIRMTYTLVIPPVEPTTGFPEGNLGAGDQVIQVGDWHPTLVPYRLVGGWQTWAYHAVGDPAVYPLADYDVRIFADPALVIAAPGAYARAGTTHHYQLKRARSFAFLVSPDYQRIEGSIEGISIASYVLPAHAEAGRAAVAIAQQALPIYRRAYGSYPFERLVIAENAYHGSMEYSGLLSISRDAYERFSAGPQSAMVSLVAHETAHQWWYHAVGSDQVTEPWLDEAFAKYSELLYFEEVAPDLVGWWWEAQGYGAGGALNATIYDFEDGQDYFRQIYAQGAHFLDDLRWRIGDATFFEFVRAYRSYGEGRLLTSEDFFALLDTYTDADLDPLIDRYFENSD